MEPRHPTDDELIRFSAGLLPEDSAGWVGEHLDQCDACREAMTQVGSSGDTLLSALRRPKQDLAYLAESGYRRAEQLAQAIAEEASSAGSAKKSADEFPLKRLREYELLEKLGEGGMGAVYKARHTRLDKIVAVKMLPSQRMQDQAAVARFDREMRAVGKLDHPHIVRAFDAGEVEGTHFLVMEYVEGLDLSQLVKRHGPLKIADACELVRQAALGLAEAHEHGMVHRDIKPSNLMLCRAGKNKPPVVKVLDLGLALLSEAHAPDIGGLTSTGQMMGTLDYMAPEQGSDSHVVDIRADIYSLGVTLYKLLTGETVHPSKPGQTPVQKLMTLATQPVPPIQSRRPEITAALAAVVHRMVEKDPAGRYATPQEVIDALRPFCAEANLSVLASLAGPGASPIETSERPTLPHLTSHDVATDSSPVSEDRRREPATSSTPPRRRLITLGAAAGGLALCLGILIIIYDQYGKRAATIDVPAGGQVAIEVKPDAKPTAAARHALQFDGTGIVNVAGIDWGRLEQYTFEAYASLDQLSENVGFIVNRYKNASLAINSSNHSGVWLFSFKYKDEDSPGYVYATVPAELKKRVHLAGVAHGRQFRLFVDGKLLGTTIAERELEPGLGGSLSLGNHFVGIIDGIRISRVARYDTPFTPPERFEKDDDTLALYRFEEGTGAVLVDSSGNGHHGQIAGATWATIQPSAAVAATTSNAKADASPTFTNQLNMQFQLVRKGKALLGGAGGKLGNVETEIPNDFYLGTYEVTQEQWVKVMGNNPSTFARTGKDSEAVKDISAESLNRFPVEQVSWNDCQAFIKQLNAMLNEDGWVYRLPTEVEWEYACRGGHLAEKAESGFDYYAPEPSNRLESGQANFAVEWDDGKPTKGLLRTCPVGSYPANRLGLHDMHGNVWEWCHDEIPPDLEDLTGQLQRVDRGGGWNAGASNGTATFRRILAPYGTSRASGLRLARVPTSRWTLRRVAEWTIQHGGKVMLGKNTVAKLEDLPATVNRIDLVDLGGIKSITDADAAVISEWPHVIGLSVAGTSITDAGLRHLAKLKEKGSFGVADTSITGEGFDAFERVPLGTLVLDGCRLSPEGWRRVTRVGRTTGWWMNKTNLSQATLAEIIGMHPEIDVLSAPGTTLGDASIESIACLANLKVLYLPYTHLTDTGLQKLESVKTLTHLDVTKTRVTAAGIARLKQALPNCRVDWEPAAAQPAWTLRMIAEWTLQKGGKVLLGDGIEVTKLDDLPAEVTRIDLTSFTGEKSLGDAEAEVIGSWPKIKGIGVAGTSITDVGLRRLAALPLGGSLSAATTSITGEGFDAFAGKPLGTISLSGCKLTPSGWQHLARIGTTMNWNVRWTNLDDRALTEIVARHPEIKQIDARGTASTDAIAPELAKLANLNHLSLEETSVSDETLKHLEKAKWLASLSVRETKVTCAGVAKLKAALPLCRVEQ